MYSIWSAVRDSLNFTGASMDVQLDCAILNTIQRPIGWDKRKLSCQYLKEGIAVRRLDCIKQHSDQGRAFDSISLHPDSTFYMYTGAFLSFPQYRYVNKARLNLLPVRTVQARCHKPISSAQCRLCGRVPETLAHVLNHCHDNLGLVRTRHNSILERIVRAIPDDFGTKMKEQPLPGTSGDNRPDLTIISPDEMSVIIVEVTCPFEGGPSALQDAADAKVTKYQPLKTALLQHYSSVEILPFVVGSLGSWLPGNDKVLSRLRIGYKYASRMRRLCVVSAIAGSQSIWYNSICARRKDRQPDVPSQQ